MNRFVNSILVFVAVFFCASCSKDNGTSGSFDVQLDIPSSITVGADGLVQFRIMFSKAPASTDVFIFEDSSGKEHSCAIADISSKYVTVRLFDGYFADSYTVSVRRGEVTKQMGKTTLLISDGVEPAAGSTVYGRVTCNGKGIKDVVVSDGFEVVTTDSDGVYQIKSEKKLGYLYPCQVAMRHPASVPSQKSIIHCTPRPLSLNGWTSH